MGGSALIYEVAGLSVLSAGSQHQRLLRLDFPRNDAPANALLLVNALTAEEELSRDFTFNVELISDNAHIDPASMMAKMVTVSMVRNNGSLRFFNGYVSAFQMVRADGGLAFYHMVLTPWLAFARLTEDCFSFHGRSVIELTEDTFADYLERDWRLRLVGEYPKLTCANQYNESDYNHLHRRWEAAGLLYWYEHRADGHTLWLSDHSSMAEPIDAIGGAAGELRFKAEAGASEDDAVREWKAVRRIKPGVVSLVSFDYKNPCSRIVYRKSLNRQGDVYAREMYQDTGYRFGSSDDGAAMAERKMQAVDADALQFEAAGNARHVLPGRYFKLSDHFSCDPPAHCRSDEPEDPAAVSEYLIVKVIHTASNNYQDGKSEHSHYDNTFTCVRSATSWRPRLGHNSEPAPDPGILTAIVVGPKGEDVYTDELGRVKVQFHWDRVGRFDLNSSPWIRVLSPFAGAYMGQQTLPRIKQEVAVHFISGNVDHPIILGGDYNAFNMPPWRLPDERPLMGLRSCEFMSGDGKSGGQRSNHLILDDTNGKIQAQLKSDHQHSQLSLGHITRIENNAGRLDFRGEGWELASDAWGVARAGRGMLITTEARLNASSHIKDMGETVQRLIAAQELHKAQADDALHFGAQEGGQQIEVAALLKKQNQGVKGEGGGDGFPELSAPHLVLASPVGIETTSAQSTHIASAAHTALTTGQNLSIATGDSLLASIRETFRIFVHKAGMKLIAASGKVTVSAQTDDIDIIAQKVLKLISESDWVDIRGRKGVRLHGASSTLEIGEKVQFFTSSPTLFHGNLETLAPKNTPQPAPGHALPPKPDVLHQTLQMHGAGGGQYANVPYALYKGDAKVEDSITDEFGRIAIQHDVGTSLYWIRLATGEEFSLCVSPRLAESGDAAHDEQHLSNQGLRAVATSAKSRWYH